MNAAAIGRWVIGRRPVLTVVSPRERQEILDRAVNMAMIAATSRISPKNQPAATSTTETTRKAR